MTIQKSDVLSAVEELSRVHAEAVASGDQRGMMKDFMRDRWQQIVGSVAVPQDLVSAEVVEVRYNEALGCPETIFRFTGKSGASQDVRARWAERDGVWKIAAERNVPALLPPPVMPPHSDPLANPHVEGLAQGELRIQRCPECDKWIWTPRHLCPNCHHFDLEFVPVEPRGVVYSWTRTVQPFVPAMSGRVPYVVVLAELPGAGNVRVLGVLDHPDDDHDPRIGDEVIGSFETTDAGEGIMRWRLAGTAADEETGVETPHE